MSATTTITKLREQNAVMAALLKRASGETLDADDREVLTEFAKSRALEQALRERYDLGGAIEKALRPSTPNALPPQEGDVAKAVGGDTLGGAIAKAFTGTKSSETTTRGAAHVMTAIHERTQKQKSKDVAKANRAPISNQRADMFGKERNS